MAVFRIERTRDYTVMSNHHLRNHELSLKATLPRKRRCKPRSTTSKAAIRGMTSTATTSI